MTSTVDPLKTRRPVPVPVDACVRTGTWTQQWLLEKAVSLPVREGCAIQTFIAGQDGFRHIAADIEAATESVNLVCWGFDPGMALVRDKGDPRFPWAHGEPYGELLKRKAAQGVKVRLLVWYSPRGSALQNSLPGYANPDEFLLGGVVNRTWDEWQNINRDLVHASGPGVGAIVEPAPPLKPLSAYRQDYCTLWWREATSGQIDHLEVRCRDGVRDWVKLSLSTEADAPYDALPVLGATQYVSEKSLLEDHATHHQKPIVIDPTQPATQVGYVMGLNSVTDYWDTIAHQVDDPRRELHLQGDNDKLANAALKARQPISRKPLQDYACRVEGAVIQDLWRNFSTAWNRAALLPKLPAASNARHEARRSADLNPELPVQQRPRGADPAGGAFTGRLQIVRTQPEEPHRSTDHRTPTDKSIKAIYWQACESARNYMYVENQYFFYEEWARHLKARRQAFMAHLQLCGQSSRQAKLLHLIVVMPKPESPGMVPRTFDTLKSLGQADSMPGQRDRNAESERTYRERTTKPHRALGNSRDQVDPQTLLPYADGIAREQRRNLTGDVLADDAAQVQAPELKEVTMEDESGQTFKTSVLHQDGKSLGLKVLVCKMIAPNKSGNAALGMARDIYIHSKLLLVDDCLMSLGSANLNQRSMAVDSEINVCTDSIPHNRELRRRVWSMQTDNLYDGGGGTPTNREMSRLFDRWQALARDNAYFIEKGSAATVVGHLATLIEPDTASYRVG